MHSQFLLVGAAILNAVTALPALQVADSPASPVERRCGTTVYPSYISWIDSRSPNGAQGPVNFISTFADPNDKAYRVAEVQFQIPPGAGGPCQLEYIFPPNALISASGHSQLQVYKTSSNITPNDTWGNAPTPTFLFGSFNPVAGTSGTVNSEGCAPTLNYFVQVFEQWELNSGSVPAGFVEFQEHPTPGPTEMGLKIQYGC
ncbi:MAG: hypothetical protein M1838_004887 [Thelocarpon superellum]|nr:MAG: hypothetical protein M1838_004887 [Thelocarpon superellum]